MFRKSLAVFVCLILCVAQFGLRANAIAYPVMGIIDNTRAGTTDIYSKPGTTGHEAAGEEKNSSKKLDTLSEGTVIRILGEGVDGDGDIWYSIQYGENFAKSGYVYSLRATLTPEYTTDPEFEAWLTEQGFPESYKAGLRELHTLYPNWVFYADHTGIEWSDALAAQSKLGKKLVSSSSDNSWKSMVQDAYDWETDTWNGFDGDSWVAATERVIAYHMDPRNFFDTTNIFMFFSQSYDAKTDNLETLRQFVKGTFMDAVLPDNPEKTYSQVIMEAAVSSKVSPYVIASTIRQEQGTNGTGGSISGSSGLYNFFNIGAYQEGGMSAVERGLWWANGAGKGETTYGRPWTTREKSIKGGAEWYGAGYIAVGQNTFYYMNFNVYQNTKYDLYSHQYATNVGDSKAKGSNLASAYAAFYDVGLSFHIPVYKNMPESTTLPTKGTSNNCYLSSLSVTGYEDELETFNRYKYGYELIVPGDTDIITVNATASDSKATVTGAGNYELQAGNNEIKITVTSTSGLQQAYTLTVFRDGTATPPVNPEPPVVIPEPEITGSYTIGTYVTGVQPETSVSSFITNLAVKNGTVKVFTSADKEKSSGNIATGDKVRIYNNNSEIKKEYIVTIYGDINGDGKISSVDLLVGQRHILKMSSLSGAYLEAADTNKDSKITSVDLLVGQRHILKFATITQ